MAAGINANFFVPGFNPLGGAGGPLPPGVSPAQVFTPPPSSGQPGQSSVANDSLGDAWQGLAGGGRLAENPALQQFQQLYGGAGESAKETSSQQKADGTKGPEGQDEETRELLKKRPDITPKDIQQMKGDLRAAFKEPAMQDAAYKKAMQALGDGGSSATPQEMGKLLSQMSAAAGKNGASAALDMFDTGRELLKTGKTAQDVGGLVEGAQAIGGGDGSTPNNVAEAFSTAAKAVQSRPDMKPQEVSQMAKNVAQRFPGKDPTERMQAFKSGTELMGQSPNLGAKGIDAMLARGQEQGLRGPKLLRSFESQGQAMREGALNPAQLGDKSTKNLSFDKEGKLNRERTSSQASPDQKMTRLGQERPTDARTASRDKASGAPAPRGPGGETGGAPAGGAPSGGAPGGVPGRR